jgi:hypothetical protein
VEVVAWAASNSDRGENADYQCGKRRLSLTGDIYALSCAKASYGNNSQKLGTNQH